MATAASQSLPLGRPPSGSPSGFASLPHQRGGPALQESPIPLLSPRRRGPPEPASPGHGSQGSDSALAATCCVGAATSRVSTSLEGRGTELNGPEGPTAPGQAKGSPEEKALFTKDQPSQARQEGASGTGSRTPGSPHEPQGCDIQ